MTDKFATLRKLNGELCEHNFGEWQPVGHLDQRRCDKCAHVEERDYTGDIQVTVPELIDGRYYAAMEEISRLRTALEWYGDEKNYFHTSYDVGTAIVQEDNGARARAALGELTNADR